MKRLFVQLISDVDCKQKVRQVVLQEKGFIQEQQGIMIGVHGEPLKQRRGSSFIEGKRKLGRAVTKSFPSCAYNHCGA